MRTYEILGSLSSAASRRQRASRRLLGRDRDPACFARPDRLVTSTPTDSWAGTTQTQSPPRWLRAAYCPSASCHEMRSVGVPPSSSRAMSARRDASSPTAPTAALPARDAEQRIAALSLAPGNAAAQPSGFALDEVCAGKMTLAHAQRAIASNWVALVRHAHPTPGGAPIAAGRQLYRQRPIQQPLQQLRRLRALKPTGSDGHGHCIGWQVPDLAHRQFWVRRRVLLRGTVRGWGAGHGAGRRRHLSFHSLNRAGRLWLVDWL
jgi:hypothetical protein